MMAMACPPERINFFRVCRVIVDHIPEVLRVVFKDEIRRQHGHTWDDTGQSGAWLKRKGTGKLRRVQLNLLVKGNTKDWDPTLLCHVLLYSNVSYPAATKQYKAVDGLRELRNNCYGHVSSGTVPAAELKTLFTEVEAAYIDLGVSPGWIQSLRAIETEPIVDDTTVQKYKDQLLLERKRLDVHEESIADLEQDVEVLKNQNKQVATEVESNKQENTAQIGNLHARLDELSRNVHTKYEELSQGLQSHATRNAEQLVALSSSVSQIANDLQVQSTSSNSQIQQMQDQVGTLIRKQEEQDLKQTETEEKLASTQATVESIGGHLEKIDSQIEELQSQPQVTVNVQILTELNSINLYFKQNNINPRCDYVEHQTAYSTTYRCTIRVGTSNFESDGYFLSREEANVSAGRKALQVAESQALVSRGPSKSRKTSSQTMSNVEMLEEYFQERGKHVIKYKKIECKQGYQFTVFVPIISYAKGDMCRKLSEAKESAAAHALEKLRH